VSNRATVRVDPAVQPSEPVVVALLRTLIDEVKGLRADLAARVHDTNPGSLCRADLARLGRLLPAIGGALGSAVFLARDLFEHESAALRLVLRGLNAKRVGRLLQRAEGQVVNGHLVERAGVELNTALWRVLQAPGCPGMRNPGVPPQAPDSLP
jgi:hypothetical protein